MTDNKRAADDAERQFTEWFAKNYPGPDTIIYDPLWHAPKILRAARAALSVCADGGKGEAVYQVRGKLDPDYGWTDHRKKDFDVMRSDLFEKRVLYTAPQAECAPREAQPVAHFIYDKEDDLWEQVRGEFASDADVVPLFRRSSPESAKQGDFAAFCEHYIDASEDVNREWLFNIVSKWIQWNAAPTPECAPREAQPVGPRTTLNYDGTFDTPCAHCGGNGCFACLKSAAPTPERADAGKDAARYQWLRDNCFDSTEPGDGDAFWHTELHFESDELQCFDKASLDNAIDAAILAANKETPERAEPRALTDDSLSALFKVLMRRNIECGIEAYLTLRCVGVPPSEKDFLSAIEQAVKER